ncbi:uncharacterized protein LOC129598960 [Paramacrobiotus metropolitanus]|uniref:uncharacterized protein LOC129598960 n=1 Tax=Paramacrobiotus metropolitanus TaxID=2943436 RepID=UPI0024463D59|nr:uncharacterized protein LOC129598960 [Paramacrobiotus metropolitanus]
MASQRPTKKSTKSRFDRWIRKSWEELSLTPRRKDAPQTDDAEGAHTTLLSAPPSSADQGSSIDDNNCGQILGKTLQPVVYEVIEEQFILGYLCDVDRERERVLVDFDCYGNPPLWLPAANVQKNRPLDSWDLRYQKTVEAAVRLESDQPYVFYPARIISHHDRQDGGMSPICVELTPAGGDVPIRKFVYPLQLRIVWNFQLSAYALERRSVLRCCHQLLKQTAPLDFGPDAEGIDLQRLLEAFNETPRIKVVRLWLDTQCVHCVYTKRGKGVFSETYLKILVQKSRCHVMAPEKLVDFNMLGAHRDSSLVKLPYEVLERTVLAIQDIHSVVSARKVCKCWHDILGRNGINQHVAIDLTNLLPESSNGPERNYNRTHLINILDTIVNTKTVSLTLINGDLSMEFGMYIFGFLSIKVTRLQIIFLKNVVLSYAVALNYEKIEL